MIIRFYISEHNIRQFWGDTQTLPAQIAKEKSLQVHQIVQRLAHAGMCEDEIAQESIFLPRLHGHCHQIDDFARLRSEQGTAQYLIGIGIHHHLEQPVRIAQCTGTGNGGDGEFVYFDVQAFLGGLRPRSCRCVKAAGL